VNSFLNIFLFRPPATQSSIEAIAESMALAEKHGVDQQKVMGILSSSIFDCLIYKVRAGVFLDELLFCLM